MRTVLAVALVAALGATGAQADPSAPITVMVGFAPGGPTDTLARIITERMRISLGQPLIVENVPGATGTIAIGRVVRAAPDGRTLSMGNWTTHVGAPAIYPIAYDVIKDLEPVSLLPIAPLLITARKAFPPNDVRELIAWLKANPGQATAAIVGFGSSGHVSLIDFEQKTGTRFQFVPYRGGGPAMNDLVAGQVDIRPTEASTALPYLPSGKIKAYAVLGKTRWVAAPNVPTIDEAGVPSLHIALWHGLWAPKNTPQEATTRLNGTAADPLAAPMTRLPRGRGGLRTGARAAQGWRSPAPAPARRAPPQMRGRRVDAPRVRAPAPTRRAERSWCASYTHTKHQAHLCFRACDPVRSPARHAASGLHTLEA
jgi:tripartite-type tricarboxylate transporter receptor subunit TctC